MFGLRDVPERYGLTLQEVAAAAGVTIDELALISTDGPCAPGARERVWEAVRALARPRDGLNKQLRKDLLSVFARFGATDVRIVGSVARGTDKPGSDLDLLARFPPDFSLFTLYELQDQLEMVAGIRVDIISDDLRNAGPILAAMRADAVPLEPVETPQSPSAVAAATAERLRRAHERLARLEELRSMRALSDGGVPPEQIAATVGTTVARVRAKLRVVERRGTGPWPEELILRAAIDGSSRTDLVAALSRMSYTFGEHAPYPHEGSTSGTWDEITSGYVGGWLSKAEFHEILAAVRPPRLG
ncbi:nucleotidyltransferase domain protein [Aeromicrobium marinum DSM 15272]|uniref:Nucleotidyltransferase domain protein n=1 Tax=Aeromicrobium marinum DSM 15272 TaxID=585531 RepID=E2S853_9ACTN|nr:nucleotidyltransferase domain-containing protein [Aeromicrobium marinum]EFQ84358.1 nucleotidyltransferase domain protein [Aeromicrobium marinum DSM 15272]